MSDLTTNESAETVMFLTWFRDQFDCGVPEPSAVSQTLAHVEGIIAADPDRFSYLRMVASHLRVLEVMLRQLKQEQVRMPK